MSTITSQLVDMQSRTAQIKAQENKDKVGTTDMGQDAFLMLMLEQLKHQDPMNPMDNQEFLAQQAQFTQLNEIQKMNSNMNINNQIMQASSLIGKDVTLVDPNDATKKIKGSVSAANFSGSQATVVVNGKDYPLGYVVTVSNPTSTADTGSSGSGSESTQS